MHQCKKLANLLLVFACCFSASSFAAPAITGTPVTDAPPILKWDLDNGDQKPNFNDEVSNVLYDFHGNLDTCDVMFSSEGNYHMALRDIWPIYLSKFKEPLKNAFYSTTPPLIAPQVENQMLQVGNLYSKCQPSVTVTNKTNIDKLVAMKAIDGDVYPVFKNRGIVLLVKKGNPKGIQSVWDLGRADVNLITPSKFEPGVFKIYTDSVYNIAKNDANPPPSTNADKLFDELFNGATGNPNKWLQGSRIHHRDEPWSVAYGKADVAVIYYHLGLVAKQTFPDTFDIIPLGGTVDNPNPLAGTVITERYVVALKGNWSRRQLEARQTLINTLRSDEFTQILEKRGLQRPDGFVSIEYSARTNALARK